MYCRIHFHNLGVNSHVDFQGTRYLATSPRGFKLVGSNDCNNWHVLENFAAEWTQPDEEHSFTINEHNRYPYSCYGIQTTSVMQGNSVCLQDIKFGKEVHEGELKKTKKKQPKFIMS